MHVTLHRVRFRLESFQISTTACPHGVCTDLATSLLADQGQRRVRFILRGVPPLAAVIAAIEMVEKPFVHCLPHCLATCAKRRDTQQMLGLQSLQLTIFRHGRRLLPRLHRRDKTLAIAGRHLRGAIKISQVARRLAGSLAWRTCQSDAVRQRRTP